MSENGTGMTTPPNNEPSGAVSSNEVGRKKPNQGKFRSGLPTQKRPMKVDKNKHGIRRETNMAPKKTGKPKKV
jgi:hypothetical protein